MIAKILHLSRCKQMSILHFNFHYRPERSLRSEMNEVDYESTIMSCQFTTLSKPSMNANFHNSTSCRIFDEVKICPEPISTTHRHYAEDRHHHTWSRMPQQNAMKSRVIINLSADILLRRLLT